MKSNSSQALRCSKAGSGYPILLQSLSVGWLSMKANYRVKWNRDVQKCVPQLEHHQVTLARGSRMLTRTETRRLWAIKRGHRASDFAVLSPCSVPAVFVQKEHSQYFEVQSTPDTDPGGGAAAARRRRRGHRCWRGRARITTRSARASDTIRSGEVDEVNPCLGRTGWLPYLEGFSNETSCG